MVLILVGALFCVASVADTLARPYSTDAGVRMHNELEAYKDSFSDRANTQSQRHMESQLSAIRGKFDAFYSAMDEYEKEKQRAYAAQQAPPKSPLESYSERAKAGDAAAMRTLGGGYLAGKGVERDVTKAMQ